MLSLADKTIVVTGASSGIGQACSVCSSQLGAKLVLVGRDESRLRETMSLLAAGDHQIVVADVTDYDKMADLISMAVTRLGGTIHGLVHSAGVEITKPFSRTTAQDYRDLLEVNLIAGLELCKLASNRKYLPKFGASYVLISSIMADLGSAGKVAYCASKSSITAAVKAMAMELASRKIRVNCLKPGCVDTPLLKNMFSGLAEGEITLIQDMHPLGLGRPEDVANICCFLLSDLATWITGASIPVDGGYSSK